jgi:hypothetical protein
MLTRLNPQPYPQAELDLYKLSPLSSPMETLKRRRKRSQQVITPSERVEAEQSAVSKNHLVKHIVRNYYPL